MELDTSLPHAAKSAVKQFPERVTIQFTHASFPRRKYEDFRIYFIWISEVPMRAACIIDFIFLVEPS